MQSVAGVFRTRTSAERAVKDLYDAGIMIDSMNLLTPEQSEAALETIPTTDAESPGIGKAITTVVGTAIGAGGGMALGTALASIFVPGVGTIFALGVGAAALLGAGGAAVGAAVGEKAEEELDTGVPRDDIEKYHTLLRNGRSLVIVNLPPDRDADVIRQILEVHGAEDVDHAIDDLKQRPSAA